MLEVRANYVALETLQDELTRVFNTGQYRDKLVVEEGRLKFKEKLCIFDSLLVPNSLIYPFDMNENWIQVADASDVPEDGTLLVNLGVEPVCLYNLGGKIFATHDTCTHGQASLADGFIEGEEIECPLHQGSSHRDRKAVGVPCTEDIRTYAVKIENGAVLLKE